MLQIKLKYSRVRGVTLIAFTSAVHAQCDPLSCFYEQLRLKVVVAGEYLSGGNERGESIVLVRYHVGVGMDWLKLLMSLDHPVNHDEWKFAIPLLALLLVSEVLSSSSFFCRCRQRSWTLIQNNTNKQHLTTYDVVNSLVSLNIT